MDRKHQYLSANDHNGSAEQTVKPKHKRIAWLDIAKGLGMVAVVCGHNMPHFIMNNDANRYLYNFIYWWHMPLFFLIAGFFLKPIDLLDVQKVMTFLKKRVWPIFSSYFVAGFLLIIAYKFIHNKSITYSLTYLLDLFYGGQTLKHYTTIFWYPETYILGIIGTVAIISLIRSRFLQLVIAAYFIYWSTGYVHETKFQFFGVVTAPWDIDVAVLVIAYMLVGYNLFYFFKHYLTKWYVFIPSVGIVGWLFMQLKDQKLSFLLFMRSHQISGTYQNVPVTHLQLALMVGLIPLLCSLVVFGISDIIAFPLLFTRQAAKTWLFPVQFLAKSLTIAGKHTLIIMYMHKMLLDVLRRIQVNSFWVQVLIATVLPVLIGMAYKQFKIHHANEWQLNWFKWPVKFKQQEKDKS